MTTWSLPNGAFRLSGEEAGGMPNFAKALSEGVRASYLPKQLAENLLAQKMLNAINKPKADNANAWFQAELNNKNLQGSILGQQLQEAMFFNQSPLHRLLKMGGPAGQIGAMMLLRDQDASQYPSQASGYHQEGNGFGYDQPPSQRSVGVSDYANNGNPNLDSAIESLPPEKRDAYKAMFSSAGVNQQQMPRATQNSTSNYAKMLEDSLAADIASKKVLNDYRRSLTETSSKRASTPMSKLAQELEEVKAGFLPGTNGQHRISPEQQQELIGKYELQMQKQSTDSDTRKRALFASNIDKTIESIDRKALTRYASPSGSALRKSEEIKSMLNPGSESKEYRDYLEAVGKAGMLSKQVRQFYGDSIQPQMLEKLEMLANPATWKNNPEIAMKLFDSFTDLLKKETGTYRGALRSTKEFEETSQPYKRKVYNLSTGRFE